MILFLLRRCTLCVCLQNLEFLGYVTATGNPLSTGEFSTSIEVSALASTDGVRCDLLTSALNQLYLVDDPTVLYLLSLALSPLSPP